MSRPRLSLRRGVNVHHMLNWPEIVRQQPVAVATSVSYVWPPFRTARHAMADEELRLLASLGFDFIRLTVDPSIAIASPPDRRGLWSDLVAQTAERFVAAGLSVVVDLHPVAVNPDYGPEALMNPADTRPFDAYLGVVGLLAARLAPLAEGSGASRIALELMNEPTLAGDAGFRRWQGMMERLHQAAREAAPDLPLVLTGGQWSSARALMRLDPAPFRGSDVLYTFHYYDPHTFTHQGVGREVARHVSDLRWPPRKDDVDAVLDRALRRIDGDLALQASQREAAATMTRKLLADYLGTAHDPARITADFAAVKDWGARHGIEPGRLLLGEFGAVRPGASIEAARDRTAWLRAVREAAERQGFPWALWAYRGYGGMALREDPPGSSLDKDVVAALGMS